MKKLLNTLYVLTPESYLFCRNENICVQVGGVEKVSVPALTIDAIVCFGKMTVSTPLLDFCGKRNISVTFLTKTGHFMGRFYGPVSGNVLCVNTNMKALTTHFFVTNWFNRFCLQKSEIASWFYCVQREIPKTSVFKVIFPPELNYCPNLLDVCPYVKASMPCVA